MKVHSFYVEEAEKHGVEKAVILYNLRFWLEKNKANSTNLHDGYYWTYNSAKAFAALFPYYKASKIERLLRQMESDSLILSGNYNKAGYDRTKWYSMPDFSLESLAISQSSNMKNGDCKNEECNLQNCSMESSNMKNAICKSEAPIPDSKPNDKPVNKTDSNSASEGKKKSTRYKPVKPESVSEQVWNDLLILRKETKASNSQTAWTTVFNGLDAAKQKTGHSLDQIITFWIGKAWKGFNADWYLNAQPKPQQTNNQVNNYEQPKQSQSDSYNNMLEQQYNERYGQPTEQAVSDGYCGNVYDMEENL